MYSLMIKRDLKLFINKKNYSINTTCYFLIICSMLPIMQPELNLISDSIKIGYIWIAMIVSVMTSQEGIIRIDESSGTLEQILTSSMSPYYIFLMKLITLWVSTFMPIFLTTPLIAILFDVAIQTLMFSMLTMLFGSIIFTGLALVCNSLTICLPRGGVILAIILFPIYIPIMILGITATTNYLNYLNFIPQIAMLLAITIIVISLIPVTTYYILKVSIP